MSKHGCVNCHQKSCSNKEGIYPKGCTTKSIDKELIRRAFEPFQTKEQDKRIARSAAEIEAEFYLKYTRLEELLEFIDRMGYQKIGIATCVGLMKESGLLARIFEHRGYDYVIAGCKIGEVHKSEIGIDREHLVRPLNAHESMCHPILQALFLESEETELNIIMGLCVGHDILFNQYSKAPVTTLVVKDRVTGNNPVAPLYQLDGYYRRLLHDKSEA